MRRYLIKYKWPLGGLALSVVITGLFFSWNSLTVSSESKAELPKMNYPASNFSGENCEGSGNRPLAVMVSSDPEARPLSAIGQADLVFEMPVTPNGVTRMMAVFQCEQPAEIGSVRSAREDFIPLALGINAVYAHFGGEKTALEELNGGVIDNIDGLKYDGTIYYRKSGIPRPHNSFTSYALVKQSMITNQYEWKNSNRTPQYPHTDPARTLGVQAGPTLYTNLTQFKVSWQYDRVNNSYLRTRGGRIELDRNTNQTVAAKNIVVMNTTWSPISKDYLRVKTVGGGTIKLYQNGEVVDGTWEKKDDKAKLILYDVNHKELKFVPGPIWVEIAI